MILRRLFQLLLAPLSLLYGIGVTARNLLYSIGVLRRISFSLPTISVGNLSVGGAGKSPHIEYLIRLLRPYLQVSTLSRGYNRKTKGFRIVQSNHSAEEVGDEPLQFKRKFPDILVAISESRTMAIPEMLKYQPDTEVVLLDDAFQHLPIIPGLNILLTEFHHPFTKDYLLPSGRLREWRDAYKRADVIIVSKCPRVVTEEDRTRLTEEIKPLSHQRIFFSYYDYFKPYYIFNPKYVGTLQEDWDVLLICAIARTDYLLDYLHERVNSVVLLEYEDHHYFTKQDIGNLRATYERMKSKKKVIITTEKDAMRLDLHRDYLLEHRLPVFALPVQVQFHFNESVHFDALIQQYLLNFKV